MATLHDEAREIYRRLSARQKTTQDQLDLMTMQVMAKCMKLIPERKEGGLHPLHRELILCLQSAIKVEKRSKGEQTAFEAIQEHLNIDDIRVLQAFMKLPKPKEYHEHLSHRPNSVQRLCNNYAEVLSKAEDYYRRNPHLARNFTLKNSRAPKEPYNWHELVPEPWRRYDWEQFCRTYPEEAKQVLAGNNLTKDFEPIEPGYFEKCLQAEGVEVSRRGAWSEQERELERMKRHADPDVEKYGNDDIENVTGI